MVCLRKTMYAVCQKIYNKLLKKIADLNIFSFSFDFSFFCVCHEFCCLLKIVLWLNWLKFMYFLLFPVQFELYYFLLLYEFIQLFLKRSVLSVTVILGCFVYYVMECYRTQTIFLYSVAPSLYERPTFGLTWGCNAFLYVKMQSSMVRTEASGKWDLVYSSCSILYH